MLKMSSEQTSISASILGLLSLISLILCAYLLIVFWDYVKNLFKKIRWKEKDTKLQVNWLYGDREPLVPGQFTSRPIQPVPIGEDAVEDELDFKDNYERKTSSALSDGSLGKIVFILRYIPDREELMVRLLEMVGFPVSQEIYSADSAYVDVQLKYNGSDEDDQKSTPPPKLDICLQQVYYFIIAREQLFFYSLVFQINTFDQSFRRTISGEVEVNLIEGLGRSIFTGNEVVLIREISPVSKKNGHEENEQEGPQRAQSPADSHLSWDYAPTESGTILSSDGSDLLPDDIPWHRPNRRILEDIEDDLGLSDLSRSVMSVPSSLHYSTGKKRGNRDHDSKALPGFSLMKRSISENIISKYSNMYPPPKDFYRIVPQTPFSATTRSPEQGSARRKLSGMFKFEEANAEDHRPRDDSGLSRSFSWPCLNQVREDDFSVSSEESSHTYDGTTVRQRFSSISRS